MEKNKGEKKKLKNVEGKWRLLNRAVGEEGRGPGTWVHRARGREDRERNRLRRAGGREDGAWSRLRKGRRRKGRRGIEKTA